MYYCFECTNKLLVRYPLEEFEVKTRMLTCSNCKELRPCVTTIKSEAVGKIDFKAFDSFLRKGAIEMLDRWDDPDFQEEKRSILISFWHRKAKQFND